jgi:hypothetical protein
MLSIKLTPFILFLIILLVLVISVIFGNKFMNKEGFIAFQGNKKPIDTVWISQYSTTKTVYKLDDNMFFDQTNGNLIELDAAALSGSNYDNCGVTIKNVLVTTRDNQGTVVYPSDLSINGQSVIPQDTSASFVKTMTPTSTPWMYPSQCLNTNPTNTFYIPWGTDTYVALFTNNLNQWGLTNMFYFNNASGYVDKSNIDSSGVPFITAAATADADPNNNTLVIDTLYNSNAKVYQLSKNVRYDIQNGNLIIYSANTNSSTTTSQSTTPDDKNKTATPPPTQPTGGITVYDRYKKVVTNNNYASRVANVDFKPWSVIDNDGQNIVLYLPSANNTVVAILSYADNSKTKMSLINLKRFTPNGLDTGSTSPTNTTQTGSCPLAAAAAADASNNKVKDLSGSAIDLSGSATNIPPSQPDSVISEYFKWYWYWKSSASASDSNSDYILKTQIVPPVCPSCPACSSGSCESTCTNCGGKGGSGTLTTSGASLFDASGHPTTCDKLGFAGIAYDACGNKVLCNSPNSISGIVNNTVDTIGGTANKIIGTAGNVVEDVVDTTGNVLNTASNDITGLFKQSGSYRYGDNTNYVPIVPGNSSYGAVNVAGINNTNAHINQRSSPYYGTQNQTVDPYSYYGQLPNNGSANYMPITTDFSKFGK